MKANEIRKMSKDELEEKRLADRKYGSTVDLPPGMIALWCRRLSFPHPQTGERVAFSAPPAWELPERIAQIARV